MRSRSRSLVYDLTLRLQRYCFKLSESYRALRTIRQTCVLIIFFCPYVRSYVRSKAYEEPRTCFREQGYSVNGRVNAGARGACLIYYTAGRFKTNRLTIRFSTDESQPSRLNMCARNFKKVLSHKLIWKTWDCQKIHSCLSLIYFSLEKTMATITICVSIYMLLYYQIFT